MTENAAVLDEGEEQRAKDVLRYERARKNRAGVITSADRETAHA